uniref:Phosphate transporter n=1 Tax=Cyanothece sp. (strain PCC 7425 / ATCC 29141) TaxID=395961 RepID=B8HY18_CYAP4
MEVTHELTLTSGVFLILALGLALGFEFVNGFHDTANAVATVIYTNTLKPQVAVVWSGLWNFLGVLVSTGAVAYSIVALLPVELVINAGSRAGLAMVFSLLLSGIIWNLSTWSLGIPVSSSHTLVGSIMGVGIANSLLTPGSAFDQGVNWGKATEVFISLLVSPIIGFCSAALLLLLARTLIRQPELYKAADEAIAPPIWIRGLLILTCTGVSFAHGSNDGQKGMGLIMLILVGIIPGLFALNLGTDAATLSQLIKSSQEIVITLDQHSGIPGTSLNPQVAQNDLSNFVQPNGKTSPQVFAAISAKSSEISNLLAHQTSLKQLSRDERRSVRNDLYLVSSSITKLDKQQDLDSAKLRTKLLAYQQLMDPITKFIPTWVKAATALALGLGTMIGWQRIVVTVGEKIGKEHLSYGQGAVAELVAAATIFAGDYYGLPISTTHVLSSGVAGTMVANRSGLQGNTLRNIILAWILTLPVCILLAFTLFTTSLYFFTNTYQAI